MPPGLRAATERDGPVPVSGTRTARDGHDSPRGYVSRRRGKNSDLPAERMAHDDRGSVRVRECEHGGEVVADESAVPECRLAKRPCRGTRRSAPFEGEDPAERDQVDSSG